MRVSLEQKLLQYINENEGWHKKVSLFVVADDWGYSPETVGRGLRKLAEKNKINVDYYDGKYSKNLAKYSSLSTVTIIKKPTFTFVEENGVRKVIMS